jgi:hypothetical protein
MGGDVLHHYKRHSGTADRLALAFRDIAQPARGDIVGTRSVGAAEIANAELETLRRMPFGGGRRQRHPISKPSAPIGANSTFPFSVMMRSRCPGYV